MPPGEFISLRGAFACAGQGFAGIPLSEKRNPLLACFLRPNSVLGRNGIHILSVQCNREPILPPELGKYSVQDIDLRIGELFNRQIMVSARRKGFPKPVNLEAARPSGKAGVI